MPMDVSRIIASVRAIGRQLSVRNGSIIVSAGNLELPEDLRKAVRDNRAQILALLTIPEGASALLAAARTAELPEAETCDAGPKLVRCVTCRHLVPNPHTPALGWCGCNAGKGGYWPQARHLCAAFEKGNPSLNRPTPARPAVFARPGRMEPEANHECT